MLAPLDRADRPGLCNSRGQRQFARWSSFTAQAPLGLCFLLACVRPHHGKLGVDERQRVIDCQPIVRAMQRHLIRAARVSLQRYFLAPVISPGAFLMAPAI